MPRWIPGRRRTPFGLSVAVVVVLSIASVVSPVTGQEGERTTEDSFRAGAEPGSGEGRTVGYLSLGESIPFVRLISESIREQAAISGAQLIVCDAQLDVSMRPWSVVPSCARPAPRAC